MNPGSRRTRDAAELNSAAGESAAKRNRSRRHEEEQTTDPLLTASSSSAGEQSARTDPEEQLYGLESDRHEAEQTAAAATAAAAAPASAADADRRGPNDEKTNNNNDNNDDNNDNDAARDENIAIDNALLHDKSSQDTAAHDFQLELQSRLQNVPFGQDNSSSSHVNDHHNAGLTIMSGSSQVSKPDVGTAEWHRIRRDSHKEVERRRRENINRGIEALAKLLPDSEKQKSQILTKAVEYIQRLKDREAQNIEKWALEKLIADQNLAELQNQNKQLKNELEQAWREAEHWKRASQSGGNSAASKE